MRSRNIFIISCVGAFALLMFISGYCQGADSDKNGVPIRIGWQIPSGTQGQIVQILKRTDILEKHGLNPTFVPFSYGGPEMDAALAGELDVTFSADQPAINLIAKGGKWKIVSRLYYDRTAIMVPVNSPVKEIKDLKGKTVASSFGSFAHRETILKEQAAGLDADKDVKNVNMDILDVQKLVMAGGGGGWGEIDAVAVWEPTTSHFELEGLVRSLNSTMALGVVAISDEFIASHPDAAVQFLVAIAQAWVYFSPQQGERVMQWYIDDSQLAYTKKALTSALKDEPNYRADSISKVDMKLTEEDIVTLERGAAWAQERGYSQAIPQMRNAVDQALLAKAMKELAGKGSDECKVILPSAREAGTFQKMKSSFLDTLPLWAFFLMMVVLTLLSIEVGQRMGARRRRNEEHEEEGAIGTVVGAVLGLLAFVIALTFGAAGGRFDASREAMLDDVTAIRTAYLRAGLVPEPHKTATRVLLRDYVELRISMADVYGNPDQLRALRERALALQGMLWTHAEALAAKDSSDIIALYSEGLTEVFSLQTRRIAFGAHFRIPPFVWVVVIMASCISMFVVGFQFGISGKRSFPAQLALALTFALVMQLIFDLDRPGKGVIQVNQQPMIDLYRGLGTQK